MSERDETTNPGLRPPPMRSDRDELLDAIGNLLDTKLEPIASRVDGQRSATSKMLNELESFKHEFLRRVEAVERRATALEHRVDQLEERLSSSPPEGSCPNG